VINNLVPLTIASYVDHAKFGGLAFWDA